MKHPQQIPKRGLKRRRDRAIERARKDWTEEWIDANMRPAGPKTRKRKG